MHVSRSSVRKDQVVPRLVLRGLLLVGGQIGRAVEAGVPVRALVDHRAVREEGRLEEGTVHVLDRQVRPLRLSVERELREVGLRDGLTDAGVETVGEALADARPVEVFRVQVQLRLAEEFGSAVQDDLDGLLGIDAAGRPADPERAREVDPPGGQRGVDPDVLLAVLAGVLPRFPLECQVERRDRVRPAGRRSGQDEEQEGHGAPRSTTNPAVAVTPVERSTAK